MQEELDILKIGHAEELEFLHKEIKKKTDIETQLKKQLLDLKNLEPSVQIVEKKQPTDPKTQGPASPIKESSESKTGEQSSGNKSESKKDEEVRKSRTRFLSSMASFFLTDNERKKIEEK